jgi:hypothetical protein
MSTLASVKFNFDHYNPAKPSANIIVLDTQNCNCRELVACIDLSNLIIGQSYNIQYSSVNNTAVFDPQNQTIRAASEDQKFSTIMYIDPSKTHIIKAEISGVNILSSQMSVVKCGQLVSCEVSEDSLITLSSKNNWEYKFDNFLIFKFIPTNGNNDVILTIPPIPEIFPISNLRVSQSPVINSSSEIRISTTTIGQLIYLSNFNGKSIKAVKNSQNYTGLIAPGVFNIVLGS